MTDHNLMNVNNLPALQPGEPLVQMSINGRVISFPVKWARLALFLMIPAWLRDSTVDPPEPPKNAPNGINQQMLEFIRSGFKNLVRLKLGIFMRVIYGPEPEHWPHGVKMPKGREDVLPVIDRMLIDFAVTQAYWHPLEITVDETSGFVTGFRLGQRLPQTVDARNATGAARPDGEGSPARE